MTAATASTARTTEAATCRFAACSAITSASTASTASAPSAVMAVPRELRLFTSVQPSSGRGSLAALDALGGAIEPLLRGLAALRDVLQRREHDRPEARHLGVVRHQRARLR